MPATSSLGDEARGLPRAGSVRFRLVVDHKTFGLRLPIQPQDEVYVYRWSDYELLAILPGELVHYLLAHHLDGVAITAVMAQKTVRKPLAPAPDPFKRQERRQARRSRRSAGR